MKTAFAALAALVGCAPSAAEEPPSKTGATKPPPIDLEAPKEFETATFALG